jgi:hypothetical protein
MACSRVNLAEGQAGKERELARLHTGKHWAEKYFHTAASTYSGSLFKKLISTQASQS